MNVFVILNKYMDSASTVHVFDMASVEMVVFRNYDRNSYNKSVKK